MDFELKHLEMVESSSQDTSQFQNSHQEMTKSSLVLDDLTEQIENLQNKLKVSYRKLLIYETENNKLVQEKNTLFFSNKDLTEHNQVLSEKNKKLLVYSEELEEEISEKKNKIEFSEKLIETQKSELSRLTKFHLKIKNTVKPYIENLKTQLQQTLEENSKLNKFLELKDNALMSKVNECAKLEKELSTKTELFLNEKSELIKSYEDQVIFLSQQIENLQQIENQQNNEILRLKKQCETKSFLENEVIRLKRLQDEFLQKLNQAQLRENEMQFKILALETSESDYKNKLTNTESQLESQTELLNLTRQQLAHKINEVEDLHLRIKMLEKLNTNLSLNLKDSLS